ncbi:hypothetical protein [Flavobacterium silvaticum]|uniref:Uncharacterized protein n=1 Tax=Flavobacterium silvaticum TaxID=1852020 RepID=A0A972FVB5_9FLAO|nr:hypothetical protein [Flavobacterium silvaticum]NMH29273.1 hypothetical protein [Flavobacterium silvaticum]
MFQIFGKLQMAIADLMLSGINRKYFHFEIRDGVFIAKNNSRNSYFSILFFFVMAVMPLNIIQAFADKPIVNLEFLIYFGLVVPIFGIIGLRKFLWLIRGKEQIIIDGKQLTHQKSGTFLTKKKVYDLSQIRNVRDIKNPTHYLGYATDELNKYVLQGLQKQRIIRAIMWLMTIGQIGFTYKNQKVRLFNQLDDSQIAFIIRELEKRLDANQG